MSNVCRHIQIPAIRRKTGIRTAVLVLTAVLLAAGNWGCGDEGTVGSTAQKEGRTEMAYTGTIVAMGDSLTAGLGVSENDAYPARLERMLQAEGHPYRVINAGINGETSSGARSRIQWVISSLNPDIIILETGANDGLRGMDPDLLRKNLNEIVSIVRDNGIGIILAGMKMPPNLGPVYASAFTGVFPEIAQKHGIALIPFFLEGVAGRPRYNQPDGIHPTSEGYARIADHIFPYVLKALHKG